MGYVFEDDIQEDVLNKQGQFEAELPEASGATDPDLCYCIDALTGAVEAMAYYLAKIEAKLPDKPETQED